MRAEEPFLVRHADLIFALKTFAASMLALVIALAIDLPRPYWAMATVYITSQPLAGATSSKAFFRVIGTLVGASMTVALVPNLINAPELLCLAIALWVGLCLYLSLLDGTPRSYVFMLGGYTVALIGFPSVADPGSIFDVALARVEEISLGIICASLVSTVVFPRSVAPAVGGRVRSWLSDARRLSRDVLLDHGTSETRRAQRLRLATDIVEIDTLATHVAYDRLADAGTARGLGEVRLRMLMLLPIITSIEDRLAALGEAALQRQPELRRLIGDLAAWIVDEDRQRQSGNEIRAAIAERQSALDGLAPRERIITISLLLRLRELVDISADCRAIGDAIAAGKDISAVPLAFHPEAGAAPVRHRDHGMALWSAAGAAVAILICCGLWIATGWADGASAPMMAAVACSFFAAQDEPARSIRAFGLFSLVAIVVVAIYQFALVPGISHVEVLIAALAPTFLLYGFLIARPKTAPIGMALAANTATLLALQSTYSADFASFGQHVRRLLPRRRHRRDRDAGRARRRRRMDRQTADDVGLADACGRGGAARPRRSCAVCRPDAASARPVGAAHRLHLRERPPRCRQPGPAAHRAQHHRPQAGPLRPRRIDRACHRRHAGRPRGGISRPCGRGDAGRIAVMHRCGADRGRQGSQ
ncbi:putative membrane protein YccC [Bradyrhizobium sp. USDA 4341]